MLPKKVAELLSLEVFGSRLEEHIKNNTGTADPLQKVEWLS